MSAGDGSPPDRPSGQAENEESLLTRFRTAETGPLMFIRELLTSMASVAAVGLLLFAVSGVWPPMVAVESGSMNPHMQKGDLIFVTEPGRYMPAYDYEDTGVVTYRIGENEGYQTFGDFGSVVVYKNPSTIGPPIIHRARFWVDDGENWYDEANKEYINAENCSELLNCPAPHGGFVTKGDNNPYYDQANGISSPVKPEWLVGTARVRIPYLGWIRLGFSGAAVGNPVVPGMASAAGTNSSIAGLGASSAGIGASTAGVPVAGTQGIGASLDAVDSGPEASLSTPASAVSPPNPTVSGGLRSVDGSLVDDVEPAIENSRDSPDARTRTRLSASVGGATPVPA